MVSCLPLLPPLLFPVPSHRKNPTAAYRLLAAAALSLLLLPFAGCKSQNARVIDPFADDVDRQTSGWGLRKLQPSEYPDMKLAWMDKAGLEDAINKSLQFLATPSSRRFYPSSNPGDTITHDQIVATLDDIKDMLHRNISAEEFQQSILSRYDVYTSIGYNDKGDVWFTGYFTPTYYGSKTRTAQFQYPIYSRPTDLQTDPITGKVMGDYPTRSGSAKPTGKLKGLELLWFKKPLEPFMIQVQGSAKVILPDGTAEYVGYAGSNGREHKGLGTQLRDAGKIDPKHVSLPAVMAYFDQHPDELNEDVMKDDRFTFQKVYTAAEIKEWPTGSLNVRVTPDRSLATDKDIFPRASLTFINVAKPDSSGALAPYQGLVLDQDTGGGIRAAGRADIFMGWSPNDEARAGEQFAQGRLFYVFLKPELINPSLQPDLRNGAGPAPTVPPPGVNGNTVGRGRPPIPASRAPATGGDAMFPGAVNPH